MYVKVGDVRFDKIKNLSYSPEASVTSEEVPINKFSVDVITDGDYIQAGKEMSLYDDRNTLWAKYWITFSERKDESTVSVTAESKLLLLERHEMTGVMYNNYPVTQLVSELFSDIGGSGEYYLSPDFSNATISGYMGHHSKKYRLQLMCFVLGAYVKTFGTDKIEILPLDETETLIPIKKTYWKPSIKYSDYVTVIKVIAYSYALTADKPETTDEWVEANGNIYIQTKQEFTLANSDPSIPVTAPRNVVEFNDIQIINQSNVSAIMTRLANFYFRRGEVQAEVINNNEYLPAEKVQIYISNNKIVSGFIRQATFAFGLQAKARLDIVPVEDVSADWLTIQYVWENMVVREEKYFFPVNHNVSITTSYIDFMYNGHRYILRPQISTIEATVLAGGTVATVPCETAVDYYQNRLTVLNVDAVDFDNYEADISDSASGIEIALSTAPSMNTTEVEYKTETEDE